MTIPVIIEKDYPSYLSEPTHIPLWKGKTNADLLEYVLDIKQALDSCNADKKAIQNIVITKN